MSGLNAKDRGHGRRRWLMGMCRILVLGTLAQGCGVTSPKLLVKEMAQEFSPGAIIDARLGQAIGFDQMLDDLRHVQVVYVGERHVDAAHHQIQLRIIQALADARQPLMIGMEMFDHTYQAVLDRWSAGDLAKELFLKQVHWYANWRYDFALYQPILDFIRQRHLKLVGLNIPFCIPPKIAIGGLESLSPGDRSHLPKRIDTSDPAHRAYIEAIFKLHQVRGQQDFESFYAAQCVWEDAMAEAIADTLHQGAMVVLAGNGHIIHKFGIPNRAHARTGKAFRTIYLAEAGSEVELSYADYIWVTPAKTSGSMHGMAIAP